MKVLVVGGAGYIGGAVTDILRRTGHDYWVYDSLVFEDHYLKDVPFVNGDVRDRKKLKAQLDEAEAVIWLAAIVGDGACALNPELSAEINQEAVKWLADNYNGRIVFPSTCSVYGARDGLLDESAPTKPLSVYAATKLASEGYLKGRDAIIFRLGTIFGKGDRFSRIRMDLVANVLTARAYHEKKLKVFGGDQYRPLLHVRDAAQAMVSNVTTERTGVYNLATENMRILDLAKEITNITPASIEVVETSFEDSRNYRVDTAKVKAIGFHPKHTIQDGIDEIYDLLETGRIKDFNNPRYTNEGFLRVMYG